MKKIVVVGGGTGSFAILPGLKKLPDVEISSIVPSTDSGGSTGRLVDEFGYLPPGDIRQCLVALADEEEQTLLRKLFTYRFDKGPDGLKGHNFGNLFLTVLRDIYGNESEAIEAAEKLFNIKGHVYRSASNLCNLVAEYENGSKLVGEHYIDEPPFPHDGRQKIVKIYTDPISETSDEVKHVILNADIVVIGPGDLYTSLLANFVVGGVSEAICKSKAKLVFIMNLVTKFGQTYGFKATDFIKEITNYVGKSPDYVLVNNTELPQDVLEKYKLENASPIEDDLPNFANVIRTDLLANEEIVTPGGDILKRSLIRHDGDKVASEIIKILNKVEYEN